MLNDAQRQAVEYIDGPSLVIAGAGSGKTRVLTHKIAFLMQQGMAAYNILALTFTNKAAREMKERIAKLVGEEVAVGLWMGTFHSIAARILRREAESIGFNPQFTIYDAADSQNLVKAIIREMALDEKVYAYKSVAGMISRAKERLLTPSDYQRNRVVYEQNMRDGLQAVGSIYQTYQSRLRASGAMDFDDLLLYLYLLFRDNDEVRQRYASRFRFVLVDEYQDTNYAQHAIVYQLASVHKRVCVVGDDAQSIYSFRGANIENILKFRELYPDARLFKLEQNYRSTQMIVGAASSLIAHNQGQIPKNVFSNGDVGEPLHILATYSDLEEADVVVRRIDALHRRSYAYGDCAILYRTNFQSRTFEEALRRSGVPYRVYGGMSFYQRKEIKDIIAYCRLAVNHHDEEALRRVINYPARGIGKTTLDRLWQAALEREESVWTALCQGHADVSKATQTRLSNFAAMVEGWQADLSDASRLMNRIVENSGIGAELRQGRDAEDEQRRENVKELLRGATIFVAGRQEEGEPMGMADYLQEIALLSDNEQEDDDDVMSGDRVTLMTVHSAKGLEFPVVFVVGMEEELFPSSRCIESPRAIEEERRLCYVAITRAMSLCYLTYARSRFRFGQSQMSCPSRFLKEIDDKFLQGNAKSPKPQTASYHVASVRGGFNGVVASPKAHLVPSMQPIQRATPQQRAQSTNAPGSRLCVGQTVEHSRFGRGVIVQLNGDGLDLKATVDFENMGRKVLLVRFAQLKVVSC